MYAIRRTNTSSRRVEYYTKDTTGGHSWWPHLDEWVALYESEAEAKKVMAVVMVNYLRVNHTYKVVETDLQKHPLETDL